MKGCVQFLNRNWLKSFGNVLFKHYYPGYQRVDTKQVKILETDYGRFFYSSAMQNYPNLFEETASYHIEDIKKSDIVLDIGACLGSFTIQAAQKAALVYALEPIFFEELCANVKLNKLNNVICLPYALGVGEGFQYDVTFCRKTQRVKTMQFEEILSRCSLQPTFLKIDCEGGEWSTHPGNLTAGMRAVEGEIHNFSYSGKRQDPIRYIKALETLGFKCECEPTAENQIMFHARR